MLKKNLGLIAGIFATLANVAIAQDDCFCDKALPLFAEDPRVTADFGMTAYITPQMVGLNESGECFIENTEGFFDEEPMASFYFKGIEYGQVMVYPREDFIGGIWMTMEELNLWAFEKCSPAQLSS